MYPYTLLISLPTLRLAVPITQEYFNHTTTRSHLSNVEAFATKYNHTIEYHSIYPRDSITIEITSTFANTTVSNAQNNARFQVINNAKNSAIAVGDDASHNVTFDSFGDKNMVNSTGSATGGWNTKNHGSNISTEPHKVRRSSNSSQFEKRDLVNLNVMNGNMKGSNVTRSGNGNTVELHIPGHGDNVVNVTIAWDVEESNLEDSASNNTVKMYVGNFKGDMKDDTVVII